MTRRVGRCEPIWTSAKSEACLLLARRIISAPAASTAVKVFNTKRPAVGSLTVKTRSGGTLSKGWAADQPGFQRSPTSVFERGLCHHLGTPGVYLG
jgi:hypothetical protein